MEKSWLRYKIALLLLCIMLIGTGCNVSRDMVLRDSTFADIFMDSSKQAVTVAESAEGAGDAGGAGVVSGKSGGTLVEEAAADDVEEAAPTPIFLLETASDEVQVSHFAYNSLSDAKKLWYRDIEAMLGEHKQVIRLSKEGITEGLDETDIDDIFQCVLNDHPELFFVEGYTYTKFSRADKLVAVNFAGTYSMDKEEALLRRKQIEAGAEALLSGLEQFSDSNPREIPEYEKVKYVYETLVLNTEYDLNAQDNQNIYSVFVNHLSVCQGYAKAAQYLLNRLGMECTLVMGTVDTGEGHAWNLVKVDGSWYYLDATWGDASYRIEEQETGESLPKINYDYLCVTTKDLLRTHILGGVVPMPECIATDANYYAREGAFFTSFDREQLAEVFAKAKEQGMKDVTVKCADIACFREMMDGLIEKQGIFEYLTDGSGVVSYAHNEKQLSLTFWVTNE